MRRLWFFVLLFALAVGFGVMIHQDPGYTLFAYQNWTVEMPLWLALIFLIIIAFIMIGLLAIFGFIFGGSNRIRVWWSRRRQKKARINTARGLLELTEGHWKQAERYLSKSAEHSDAPLINYLSAAKAAEAQGTIDRRDRYLELAYHASPTAELAVKLTEAKLQYKHGNIDRSITILEALHEEDPKQVEVLRLLSNLYEKKKDWQALFILLPSIKKANLFPAKDEEFQFEKTIYASLLPYFKDDKKLLIDFWNASPRSITSNPDCIYGYATILHQIALDNEAEKLLKNSLNKNWQDNLVDLYGKVTGASPKKQLSFAESLLEREPKNSILYLTLGRLCLKNQLWGKARDYLEESIQLKPNTEAYALLGSLMDRLGEKEKSEQYFKKGLNLALPEKFEF
jgi:HemY protein